MRLKVKLKVNKLTLPFNYRHILQGTIYNMLGRNEEGMFYHDDGYRYENKLFKMFVFSDLYGKYEVVDKNLVFNDVVTFYIGALDNEFMGMVYNFLLNNDYLFLAKQKVEIMDISVNELPHFNGEQNVIIKTLSPVVACTTDTNKYVHFYNPDDKEFFELIRSNLEYKAKAFNYPIEELCFKDIEVKRYKKVLARFKNTFYESYQLEIKVTVNYDTLNIIYNAGLSAKGSCGFGMINYEKDILSV